MIVVNYSNIMAYLENYEMNKYFTFNLLLTTQIVCTI